MTQDGIILARLYQPDLATIPIEFVSGGSRCEVGTFAHHTDS